MLRQFVVALIKCYIRQPARNVSGIGCVSRLPRVRQALAKACARALQVAVPQCVPAEVSDRDHQVALISQFAENRDAFGAQALTPHEITGRVR
jgi:hypothetical protein